MIVRNKNSAAAVRAQGGETTYELIGNFEKITPHQSVAYIELEPGTAALKHQHHHTEEIFYILAGEAIAIMDEKRKTLTAGDCVFIPKGCVHQLINSSAHTTLVYLAICAPAWVRHSGKKIT